MTLASAVAGLLNPHFFSLYAYSWRTQTSTVQQSFIREWQSPDFHSWEMRGFEAMVVLLLIGLALRRGRPTLFSVVGDRGHACCSPCSRGVTSCCSSPPRRRCWHGRGARRSRTSDDACRALARGCGSRRAQLVRGAALVTAVVAIAVLVVLRSLLAHQAASTLDNYPSGAADYLDAHPNIGTHMFSDYAWGGYFIYRFYPEPQRRVFIFGEADLMGDTIMNQYVEVVGLHSDWMDVLNSHNVDYVVFEPDRPLTSALAASPNWHLVYSDKLAVIYVRG